MRLLEEVHRYILKVQVIESHDRMQATICLVDKILLGSNYLILNSVFKQFMDDIGPLFIFTSHIFAELFHVG